MSDDRPVLDQVNLVVADMQASTAFYRRLGLQIEDHSPLWDAHHRTAQRGAGIDFELDSTTFAPHWNRGWAPGRKGPVVGFRVAPRATVDALYADLTGAGYRGLQPPYDAFWGARYAIVEDPDGNAVGLMSQSDPARRAAPPDPATFK